jgi:hypothetical protein
MKLRVVHFLAILLTAPAFIPAGADCHDLLGCVAWAPKSRKSNAFERGADRCGKC